MAEAALKRSMALAEFLAWDAEQPERWEFYDGRPWLKDFDPDTGMAGGTISHALISANVLAALRQRLASERCRPLGEMRVVAGGHVYLPDASVLCRAPVHGETEIEDPTVLVEVLSPSTEKLDRVTKWRDYQSLPSLRIHLLIAQDAPVVEIFARAGNGRWIYERFAGSGAAVPLREIGMELPLAEIFEGVPLPSEGTETATRAQ